MSAARDVMINWVQNGYIPPDLAPHVTVMLSPQPPPWRPFKRHEWNCSAKRVLDWFGLRTRWSWLNFMWEIVP